MANPQPTRVGGQEVEEDHHADEAYQVGLDALAAGREEIGRDRFVLACAKNHPQACFSLARLIEIRWRATPETFTSDPAAVAAVTMAHSKACDLGFQRACAMLAHYFRVTDYGMQDIGRAVALARPSCEAGDAVGCDLLARMYLEGEGPASGFTGVPELFRRQCDVQWQAGTACYNYALMLAKGLTIAGGDTPPLHYYRLGCRQGLDQACNILADDYLKTGTVGGALIAAGLYQQSCDRGYYEPACIALAKTILEHQIAPDFRARAAALYRSTCNTGLGEGCLGLGNLARQGASEAGVPSDAVRLFIEGCELGSAASCYSAGVAFILGLDVPKDLSAALAWFGKGCSMTSAKACVGAAVASRIEQPDRPNSGAAASLQWLEAARGIDPAEPLLQVYDEWMRKGAPPGELGFLHALSENASTAGG
jgi:hypothetical protein